VPDLGGECERTGDGLELALMRLGYISSDRYFFSGGDNAMEHRSAPRFKDVVAAGVVIAANGMGA